MGKSIQLDQERQIRKQCVLQRLQSFLPHKQFCAILSKTHASTASHKEKERLLSGKTSQRVLVTKENNNVVLSEESSAMSFGDQVLHAEILRALDVFKNCTELSNE